MDDAALLDVVRQVQADFSRAAERLLERSVSAAHAQAERFYAGAERTAKATEKLANAVMAKLPIERELAQALWAVRDDVRLLAERVDAYERARAQDQKVEQAEAEALAAKVDAARAEVREISGVHDIREHQRKPTSIPPPEAGRTVWFIYVISKIPWRRFLLLVLVFLLLSVFSHPAQLWIGRLFGEVAALPTKSEDSR